MHIALCTPCSLHHMKDLLDDADDLPQGYLYPQAALLARTLLGMGHQVTVVTNTVDCPGTCVFKGENLTIVCTQRRPRARQWVKDFYQVEVQAMRKALLDQKPDIVHAQWCYEFADAALQTGLPTLVTVRDSPWRIAWIMRQPFRWWRAIYAHTWVLPKCRHLSTISEYMRLELRRFHSRLPEVQVIPNGIILPSPEKNAEYKKPIHWICVSEWGRLKNLKRLLRAFALALRKEPDLALHLYGKNLGPGEACAQWSQKHSCAKSVFFHGYRKTEEIYSSHSLGLCGFVSSTLEESFGSVFIEAMAHGLPCAGGRSSGAVSWILDEGRAGYLFDAKNSKDICRVLLEASSDGSKSAELAAAGRLRVRRFFDIQAVASAYLEVYRNILSFKK